MYKLLYNKKSTDQLKILKKNSKLFKRCLQILADIEQDPFSPNYKCERLKSNYAGYYSKRLDQKNRIVYYVQGNIITVIIVSLLGHYDDK